MDSVILLILGIITGYIFSKIMLNIMTVGDLWIDRSDPSESPYLFLELKKGFNSIYSKNMFCLRLMQKILYRQNNILFYGSEKFYKEDAK